MKIYFIYFLPNYDVWGIQTYLKCYNLITGVFTWHCYKYEILTVLYF